MKLFIASASPFVRKCRIVAREKGLSERIEEIPTDAYAAPPDLLRANPIAQIPALVLDDGTALIDSPLICAWLDAHGDGPVLIPRQGDAHWETRRLEALADGALELGVKWLLEKRRPENERSPSWIQRWSDGLARALDTLEQEHADDRPFDLASLTAAVAVTWVGFRHPDFDVTSRRPRLASLTQSLESRTSFIETRPQ